MTSREQQHRDARSHFIGQGCYALGLLGAAALFAVGGHVLPVAIAGAVALVVAMALYGYRVAAIYRQDEQGERKLYISHSATGATLARRGEPIPLSEWFIVEPRDDPDRLERELESLRDAGVRGRTVLEVELPEGAGR